jgi:hypothetical protein
VVATKVSGAAVPVPRGEALAGQQEALLQSLGEGERAHVERVREWFAREDRHTLESRYDLGEEIKSLYESQAGDDAGSYGQGLVDGLCRLLGWERGVVYDAMRFVTAYTRDEVTELARRPMADGRLVPYRHLLALAALPKKKDRDRLLKEAMAKCWTRAELRNAIAERAGGTQREGGDGRGRPFKRPKDLRGLLLQQEHAAGEFVQRAAKVWAKPRYSLMGTVKKLPPKQVAEDRVKRLREHADTLRELADKAGEQAAAAERAAQYLEEKLAASPAKS